MAIPSALTRLAQLLMLRKSQKLEPYRLLLTINLSLTAEVRQRICQDERWSTFRTYLRQLGPRDRLSLLTAHLESDEESSGYRALARLIKEGYFSIVLTGGVDSRLERALAHEGLPGSARRLVIDREQDSYIREELAARRHSLLLLKLRGSLQDSTLLPSFPDLLEFRPTLRESLRSELNQDLIVVGAVEHEEAILRLLSSDHHSSLYYITPQEPAEDDSLLRIIEARMHDLSPFLINGPYGSIDSFFPTLESLLITEQTPAPTPPPEVTSTTGTQRALQLPQSGTQSRTGPHREADLPTADVLLVTVTEVEARAVLELFPSFERHHLQSKTCYLLGNIQGARIAMIQSEMGQGGTGGSLLTVSEGIQALHPSAVVMVGIAFGLKPQEQQIGDILVARQILAYELQAVVADGQGTRRVRLRGDRVTASPRLLDRFKSGFKDWPGQPVEFGLLLSGEKLINDLEFRNQLLELEPEAIGGEMEGAGLCAAALHHKVDWILVKAIADWADGHKQVNKQHRQAKAARNASRFVLHVLERGGFVP
jgi:nucleoside phosphorylase